MFKICVQTKIWPVIGKHTVRGYTRHATVKQPLGPYFLSLIRFRALSL